MDRLNNDRKMRNYLRQVNIEEARVWFRYRSRMTVRIKANIYSEFRNNMGCKHCYMDLVEFQEHL